MNRRRGKSRQTNFKENPSVRHYKQLLENRTSGTPEAFSRRRQLYLSKFQDADIWRHYRAELQGLRQQLDIPRSEGSREAASTMLCRVGGCSEQ